LVGGVASAPNPVEAGDHQRPQLADHAGEVQPEPARPPALPARFLFEYR